MKFLATALAASALTLAACSSGNDDAVENADLNQVEENLDQAASDAANDVANAEAEALSDQMNELNAADVDIEEPPATPTDEREQNVAGM